MDLPGIDPDAAQVAREIWAALLIVPARQPDPERRLPPGAVPFGDGRSRVDETTVTGRHSRRHVIDLYAATIVVELAPEGATHVAITAADQDSDLLIDADGERIYHVASSA